MYPSYACSFCMVGIPKDSLKYLSNFSNVCLHSDVSHLQVCSVVLYSNFLPVTNQHVQERLRLIPACPDPFRISLSTSIRILDKTMHFNEDWKLINFFLLLTREVFRIWLFYKESFVFWYIMVISLANSEDRILRALRFFFASVISTSMLKFGLYLIRIDLLEITFTSFSLAGLMHTFFPCLSFFVTSSLKSAVFNCVG